jgi:hypothetical protein
MNSIDWSPDSVLNREEIWLNSNNNSFMPIGLYVSRSNVIRNQLQNRNSINRRDTNNVYTTI